jgi:hypothetical protein
LREDVDGSEHDRVEERDDWLVKEDTFENDRLGDMLIDGERAGVLACDGQGERGLRPGGVPTGVILSGFDGVISIPRSSWKVLVG